MLLEAARRHQLDLAESWMIGDSEHDVLAGKSAGCRTARLMDDTKRSVDGADVSASSLCLARRGARLSGTAGSGKVR